MPNVSKHPYAKTGGPNATTGHRWRSHSVKESLSHSGFRLERHPNVDLRTECKASRESLWPSNFGFASGSRSNPGSCHSVQFGRLFKTQIPPSSPSIKEGNQPPKENQMNTTRGTR